MVREREKERRGSEGRLVAVCMNKRKRMNSVRLMKSHVGHPLTLLSNIIITTFILVIVYAL